MKPILIGTLAGAALIVAFVAGTQIQQDPERPMDEMGDAPDDMHRGGEG